MNGQKIGYIRVSTLDQKVDRQLEGLELDRKFIEYASGKDTNRPQLQEMLLYIREGDQVYIHSMDRLARHLEDLLSLVNTIVGKKARIHFVTENLNFSGEPSPINNLLLCVMGSIAEFERSLILERQREGIAIAKAKGKYKGGKKKLADEQVEVLKRFIDGEKKSKGELARELGISMPTFYKYVKEIQQQTTMEIK